MLFKFKAVTQEGRIEEGVIEGESKWEVIEELESKDLIPLEVKEQKGGRTPSFLKRFKIFRRRFPKRDILVFTNSLHILLKSGLPLDRALSIAHEVVSSELMKDIVKDLIGEIRQGTSLSEALSKYPGYFPPIYVNMVKAGEAGGVLPEVLERLYDYLEKTEEFKSSLLASLTYPAVLVGVGMASIAFLIAFVVPKFSTIFESMNLEPPFFIKLLSGLGEFMSKYLPFLIALALILFLIAKRRLRTEEGKMKIYRFLLSLPVVGGVLIKVENARFSRNLGMLMLNGVPILQSLSITKEIFENPIYRNEVDRFYEVVKKGGRLSTPMAERKDFWHPVVLGMAEVGEESGTLDQMLIKAADALEKDVQESIKRALSLIEPATILVMGIVVGSIVVSMLTAIFSINDVVF